MTKVLLFNDTRYDYHHGSNAVVTGIIDALKNRGINNIDTVPVGKAWENDLFFVKKISSYSLILVNGEGTIHDDQETAKYLVNIAPLAKQNDIPCFLINTIFHNNSDEIIKKTSMFTGIYVRDRLSQKALEIYSIKSKLISDLSFYWPFLKEVKQSSKKIVGFTDSVFPAISETLYKLTIAKKGLYLPALTTPIPIKFNLSELVYYLRFIFVRFLFKILSYFINLPHYRIRRNFFITGYSDYINKIASCKLIYAARFHSLCFAIKSFTPVIAIASNSPKVEALIDDIGLDKARIINREVLVDGKDFLTRLDYSPEELDNIRAFLIKSKLSIDNMYDEICSHLREIN